MQAERTIRSPVKNAFQKTQGALLLISVLVALVVSIGQIRVTTPATDLGSAIDFPASPSLGIEVIGLAASLVALALGFRQGRLRVPAFLLSVAAALPIYFQNFRGSFPHPILAITVPFPPVPEWAALTFTFLVALSGAATLVSLWRHKHDPDAAF